MPPALTGKRSRLITLAASGAVSIAGVLSLAGAGPASAATLSGSAAAHSPVTASMSPAQAIDGFDKARFSFGDIQLKYDMAVAKTAAEHAAAKAAAAKAAAAKAAAAKAAARAARPATTQTAAVTTSSGTPQQIAQGMLGQYGWSASQFSCLQPLWQKESNWSVTASNPGSGAYGIAQALPGSKMASAGADWQTDAATQIRWGLRYIQTTYGSPCAAWSHEEADGWY